MEQQDDHKHLQTVGHPRLADTPFRSPQLTLFDLGPGEWLLYWKTPEYAPAHRRHRDPFIVQLPLFELPPLDMAVGADTGRGSSRPYARLQLVVEPDASVDTDT